ncbi:glycosyltransferase [Methanobrevibacter sp. 87.7]|uniref:glycosyltransferase family 2 protein n=1 Tax=Methanobrevibacter sp. 87.7 TaxID=387957 RepID=UPI000B505B71|nr:glycosyltransferase family 2 protein [Methanobrevibacter sp. 87.7]OWT33487.1 glycosyltransferase [Methanobrevibacter sp. 87.7]
MVKVSVVIPVYNVEDFLGECLDSIINQTLNDIEIICVNDGSKDKSLEILNEYANKDNRITVISQKNGGHAAATNRGMELAKGKYLYLMDSDDILDLTALEKTYNLAEEKNADLVIFQAINYYMDKDEYVKAENYSMNELADYVGDKIFNYKDIKDFLFKIAVTPWSKLYNNEFVKKSGAKFPEGLIFDDNVFFFEVLFNAERIAFYREHLFKRRWYSSSSTTAGDKRFADTIEINNLIIKVFIKYGLFDEFKEFLFNRKIKIVYMRFKKVKDEFKPYFYDKMKEDFESMLNDEIYDGFLDSLSFKNRTIFENVINSSSCEEFLSSMEVFDLKNKINSLMDENKYLKKLNKELLDSNSWKITKPLRKIRNRK